MPNEKTFKYLSLFSGIGGFELGIQQAYEELCNNEHARLSEESKQEERPFRRKWATHIDKTQLLLGDRPTPLCVGFSEIDKYACQVYNKHFKHKNYGDVTKIDPKVLPDFELLVGGFPCQAFSIAGKRAGFDDTRGTMFFEIARIVREKQPRLLLLENVKGLLSHDKGRTFTTIISTLDELGYDCQWQVLNSKNFGVPQNRERVFIVGHLRGTSRPEVFPLKATARADSFSNTIRTGGRGSLTKKHNWDVVVKRQPLRYLNRNQKNVDGDYAFTVDASQTSGIMLRDGRDNRSCLRAGRTPEVGTRGQSIRRLNPKECERLQGFPDDWTKEGTIRETQIVQISDTQRYKMCGNAVTVNVIKEIMTKIV